MQKFKATYTPKELVDGKVRDGKPRSVTVLEFVNEEDDFNLLFVDKDNTIGVEPINRFSNCEVWDN